MLCIRISDAGRVSPIGEPISLRRKPIVTLKAKIFHITKIVNLQEPDILNLL